MTMLRTLVLLAALSLVGCSTTSGHGYSKRYSGNPCPDGTVPICIMGARRTCHCGELIFD